MARVTVEDCIDKVDSRFELVLLAAHRARTISSGAEILVPRDNNKNPVVALREIAEECLVPGDLREDLIHSRQKYVEVDEPEQEVVPVIGSSTDDDIAFDRPISEEELLAGLEGLVAPEAPPVSDEEDDRI